MAKNRAAVALGRRGGKARAAALTAERRREIAAAGAQARWTRAREAGHVAVADPPHTPVIAPFLKWAGGKRSLLPAIRRFYPERIDRYIEPFLGGGAVCFDLLSRPHPPQRMNLGDANPRLIDTYKAVAFDAEAVLEVLAGMEAAYREAPKATYSELRARFNAADFWWQPQPARAALMVFLNRTGFNGLYRVNARGQFNVPMGTVPHGPLVDAAALRDTGWALRERTNIMWWGGHDFEETARSAHPGDFVYFDPPYTPESATANFTGYTSGSFTAADHARLAALAIELCGRGVTVLLSHAATTAIDALYDTPTARSVGLAVELSIPARRSIAASGGKRGPTMEYLISNRPPAMPEEGEEQ